MLVNLLHASDAIILLYDVSDVGSFGKLEDWIKRISSVFNVESCSRFSPEHYLPLLALVGHKVDLSNMKTVKQERHNQLMKETNIRHSFFTSAKRGYSGSIPELFKSLAEGLVDEDVDTRLVNHTIIAIDCILNAITLLEPKRHRYSGSI